MNYRYIKLCVGTVGEPSGFGKDFDSKFLYNTEFISNFLSLRVRKLHLQTGANFNMLCCNIYRGKDSIRFYNNFKSLDANLHVSDEEIRQYLKMNDETERFEYYLALIERGYRLASTVMEVPIEDFLKIHDELRNRNYRNERLFKRRQIKEYKITVILEHILTSYEYKLRLTVHNIQKGFVTSGSIYTTYPDYVFYGKTVRHLVIDDDKLIITDFLNHPMFVCNLEDLAQGIVKSECVDEHVRKYIPCEENRAKFERLRW